MYVGGNRHWVPLFFCNSGIKLKGHATSMIWHKAARLYQACYDLNDGLFGF